MGAAWSEAFFKNESSHLTEPDWIAFYGSLAEESTFLTDTHPLIIRIRSIMIHYPELMAQTTQCLHSNSPSLAGLKLATELRLRSIHRNVLEALNQYKEHILHTSMLIPPEFEIHKRREAIGSILEGLCVCKRMLASLCEPERVQLETEAQALARALMAMKSEPHAEHAWVFTNVEYGVAQLVLDTKEVWEEGMEGKTAAVKAVASYKRWTAFHAGMTPHAQGEWELELEEPGHSSVCLVSGTAD